MRKGGIKCGDPGRMKCKEGKLAISKEKDGMYSVIYQSEMT